MWARSALKHQERRFPARAVHNMHAMVNYAFGKPTMALIDLDCPRPRGAVKRP